MFLAPKLNIQIVTGKERSVATELTTAFNSKTGIFHIQDKTKLRPPPAPPPALVNLNA